MSEYNAAEKADRLMERQRNVERAACASNDRAGLYLNVLKATGSAASDNLTSIDHRYVACCKRKGTGPWTPELLEVMAGVRMISESSDFMPIYDAIYNRYRESIVNYNGVTLEQAKYFIDNSRYDCSIFSIMLATVISNETYMSIEASHAIAMDLSRFNVSGRWNDMMTLAEDPKLGWFLKVSDYMNVNANSHSHAFNMTKERVDLLRSAFDYDKNMRGTEWSIYVDRLVKAQDSYKRDKTDTMVTYSVMDNGLYNINGWRLGLDSMDDVMFFKRVQEFNSAIADANDPLKTYRIDADEFRRLFNDLYPGSGKPLSIIVADFLTDATVVTLAGAWF